jgi:ABC-type dipeptide/oligopeptide/nickel transport system permease subunit
MTQVLENIEWYMTIALIFLILVVTLYIFISVISAKKKQEWERRIIAVVLFFAVDELALFLKDPLISQLTNILFVISLLYALFYVFTFEEKIANIEEQRKEFLKGLEEIRNIKVIREKLKK